jgi:hypothetical protein
LTMLARTKHVSSSSVVALVMAVMAVWACVASTVAQAQLNQPATEKADSADVDREYTKLVSDAVAAFDAGQYRESREMLARAHQLRPNARTLRGMGLAAFEEGHYSIAVLALEGALAETRQPINPAQRDEVELLRAEANSLTARYNVRGMLSGNELRVDAGEPLWDSRGLLLLDQGAHTVTLRSNTGDVRSWSVQAQGGRTSDLDLTPPPALVATEAPAPPIEPLAPVPEPSNAGTPTGIPNVVAYAGLAGAALTGTLAIWQWQVRESEVDDWNSSSCLRRGRTRRANCGEHEDAYQSAEAWAWVAAGATVVLAAGAVTLLMLNRRGEEQQPTAAGPICVPGPAAFACRVSF